MIAIYEANSTERVFLLHQSGYCRRVACVHTAVLEAQGERGLCTWR